MVMFSAVAGRSRPEGRRRYPSPMSRPSTSLSPLDCEGVDARDKPGHDEQKNPVFEEMQ
jgi:hypothetical protein